MPDHPTSSQLLAADSFRVRVIDGVACVRGFDLHLARFAGAAIATGAAISAEIDAFLATARGDIARYGEGFPRLEVVSGGTGGSALRVALRPLPALTDHVDLRTAHGVTLEQPRRKGPNIARLTELGRSLGAEPLLLDADGAVLEGATTSLLWWDGDVLVRVASEGRVASVTERLVVAAARARGIEVAARMIVPAELVQHEVWAVNALHGIRPVSSLDGDLVASPGPRLAEFQADLDRTWQPVLPAGSHGQG